MVVSWRGKVNHSLKALLWVGGGVGGVSLVYLAFITFWLYNEHQTTCII